MTWSLYTEKGEEQKLITESLLGAIYQVVGMLCRKFGGNGYDITKNKWEKMKKFTKMNKYLFTQEHLLNILLQCARHSEREQGKILLFVELIVLG